MFPEKILTALSHPLSPGLCGTSWSVYWNWNQVGDRIVRYERMTALQSTGGRSLMIRDESRPKMGKKLPWRGDCESGVPVDPWRPSCGVTRMRWRVDESPNSRRTKSGCREVNNKFIRMNVKQIFFQAYDKKVLIEEFFANLPANEAFDISAIYRPTGPCPVFDDRKYSGVILVGRICKLYWR